MTDTTNRLDELREKYGAVFQTIEDEKISLTNVHLREGKLFIQGAAPSLEATTRVEAELTRINPEWESEVGVDLRTEEGQADMPNTGQTTVNGAQSFSNP